MKSSMSVLVLLGSLVGNVSVLQAETQDAGAGSGAGSLFLESIALLLIGACLLAAAKLYRNIRRGKLGRSWLWFLLAFGVLGIAQLLLFGGQLGVFPSWGGGLGVDVLRLLSLSLLLVGVTRLRKLLA